MNQCGPSLLTVLAVAALALGAPAAVAQQAPGPMGPGTMMGEQMQPGQMQPGQMMGDQMRHGQMQGGPQGPRARMGGDGAGRRQGRHERRAERRFDRRMEILDTTADGKLSLGEITSEQRRLFGAADINGDGKLSVDEFRRRGRWFMRLRTMTFFDMLDADGDGHVSAQEITDPTARWFKRYDANKDGALEGTELETLRDVRGDRPVWRR